jgi:hypothetical protein
LRLSSVKRDQISEENLFATLIAGLGPIQECAKIILHIADFKDIELDDWRRGFN